MSSKFGVDVAIRRADDLDKKCLAEISTQNNPTVLDLGCGAGGQSFRMAKAGAKVLAVDIGDYSKFFDKKDSVDFVQSDITEIISVLQNKEFDFCMMQRVIHYFPYDVALKLLTELRSHVKDGLFISVTGIDSDIGDQYLSKDVALEARFSQLTEEGQETFSITEPVCLYTPVEFVELLTKAGFEVEECWTSAFQNSKAVCR